MTRKESERNKNHAKQIYQESDGVNEFSKREALKSTKNRKENLFVFFKQQI